MVMPPFDGQVLDELFGSFPVAIFYKDRLGRYLGCNQLFTEIMGVSSEQIRGKTVFELWPGDLAQVYHQKDLELMARPQYQRYDFNVRDKTGRLLDVIYSKTVFRDAAGEVAGIIGAFLDVTELHDLRRELERQASTDSLTGLHNRRHFYQQAEREFVRVRRHPAPLSLMVLDVDFFKRINDTHGHQVGDQVLLEVARHFQAAIRTEDLLARLGGEEFAILMPNTPLAAAGHLAERLRASLGALRIANVPSGAQPAVSVSIGVAELAPDDAHFDALFSRADRALYQAKAQGRNRVRLDTGRT